MYQVRNWLSERIAPLHAEVDRRASGFDITTKGGADSLMRFLSIGIHDLENGLDAAGAATVLSEYKARVRAHLLPRPLDRKPVSLGSEAEVWGALYVLEGSRLGGRWLANRSEHLRINAFFAKDEPVFWPTFLSRLEKANAYGVDRMGMLAGAEAAFGAFLRVAPDQNAASGFVAPVGVGATAELMA
ncbi:hypothetical protein RDV64_21570 [Acuticoccus sp. MNP-M23]|uniref:hypothetical protein n=1 Tax=Acuticoccus sp. MNP-M23 TaxID=3072793 RepID=UPI0028159281|nr:hypothetical protein [Acuticoccus sp. MNP-M23]WMS42617.1 hypothetical protein RDV64_21570 [Acuticoccus sp. MNP-M23]